MERLKPEESSTQIADSITAACSQLRAHGKKATRLLLVSDGNDLGGADPVEAARELGLIVDVLAIPDGAPAENPVVAIQDVQTARRVLAGSETHFRLILGISQPAARARPFTIEVAEDGRKILEQKRQWQAGQAEQTVALAHRPAGTGFKQYAFTITEGGQTSKAVEVGVQVVDRKFEILVLEDTWRWDYKFLQRLFEDDPSFRFSALVARGKGAFVQFGSPDRRVNLIGFPQNRADLEGFDIFFLGDVAPTRWPRGVPAALAHQVREEGKSLVVVAGPNLAKLAEVPELQALLPVEFGPDPGKPLEVPIDVRLGPDSGQASFFFQVQTGAAQKLIPLDQIYAPLRKCPGATVLLEAAKERNPYGNLIVMAEHTVGRGQVLFVGTDTLWKWHTLAAGDGPTPYSIFWQQALRTLAPARSNLGPVDLWLTPSRSRGEVGRSLTVRAELHAERALANVRLEGAVTLPGEKQLPLLFVADPAQPRQYRADFSPAAAGLYRVSATALSEGKTAAEAMLTLHMDEARGEDTDRGVDARALARLAAATGGNVVDPARPDTWPDSGASTLPATEQFQSFDLWNNFTLLLVLCALLGTDWFVRLVKGLV